MRCRGAPDKDHDLCDQHDKGQGNFDFYSLQRLGHIVQPPGVDTGRDAYQREYYCTTQTVPRGDLKRFDTGDQIKNVKYCGRKGKKF